jgi:hypothetical protein
LIGEPLVERQLPRIQKQVTFLYFNDLDRAAAFYGTILKLPKTFDQGWVKIFELSPTSSVGLVDAIHGAHKPASEKPVMLSLVMATAGEVDRWYAYLRGKAVEVREPPRDSDRVPVHAFEFNDPEGHSLEVFAWLAR